MRGPVYLLEQEGELFGFLELTCCEPDLNSMTGRFVPAPAFERVRPLMEQANRLGQELYEAGECPPAELGERFDEVLGRIFGLDLTLRRHGTEQGYRHFEFAFDPGCTSLTFFPYYWEEQPL